MRRTCIVLSLACSAVLSLPSAAQTVATLHPMSQKYRDAGAKPATGRSGSASLEVRALRGLDGKTDLEVTTGGLEAGTTRGVLDKVQVKLLAPDGESMQTDNTRPAAGYASYAYAGLARGLPIQVQANVGGVDGRRTDVVTVRTEVKLRPDIEAAGLNAPASALVDAPVVINAVMAETNGDVGARATCRLLADGVEIAAIPGAWVDAGSNATCLFQTSFSTPGTKQLRLVVTDVAPGDFDPANNEFAATIEVSQPGTPFRQMAVNAHDENWTQKYVESRRFVRSDGAESTLLREFEGFGHNQWMSAYGYFEQSSSLDEGTIGVRFWMDGEPLPAQSMAVADMVYGWNDPWWACRYTPLTNNMLFQVCRSPDYTQVWGQRHVSDATYVVDRTRSTGDAYGWWSYDNSGASYTTGGEFIAFGSVVRAELSFQNSQGSRVQSLEAQLYRWTGHYDNWATPYCWANDWSDGTESGCWQQRWHNEVITGYNWAYN